MKTTTNLNSHEIWHKCTNCGTTYDRRAQVDSCPKCGTVIADETGRFIYPVAILLMLIIFCSCSVTKTTYKVRRHQNRMLQEVIQYQSSTPSGQDWIRPYRNWDRRPHGKRPFQFLQ